MPDWTGRHLPKTACGMTGVITMRRLPYVVLAVCALLVHGRWAGAAEGQAGPDHWYHDYRQAMDAAAAQKAMLLVYFRPLGGSVAEFFESLVLADPDVRRALGRYVCLQLEADAQITVKGRPVGLLAHAAFRDMKHKPGVAILDLAHPDAAYYGRVVSALPFTEDRCYSASQLAAVLELPPGSGAERWRAYWERMRRTEMSPKDVARTQAARTDPQAAPANMSDDAGQRAETQAAEPPDAPAVQWLDNYAAACRAAKAAGRMLFIYFYDPADSERCPRFEAKTLGDKTVAHRLQDYVCLRLPLSAEIQSDGQPQVLLEHGAFRHMEGRPGVAILDFAHPGARYYGHVVSTFPLTERLWYSPGQMQVILDLPPGELTQRTLIYAVRIHPERPASTAGTPDPYLLEEASAHARYQARIRLQGHHRWESRFHRINARLPAGLTACEVCAESWPGEGLVEAAIECVRSWRHSSGHWSAVSSFHPRYGYDMRRGSNGVWYATGIFGRGRIARAGLAQEEKTRPDVLSPGEAELAGPQPAGGTPGSLVDQATPAER